MELYFPEPRSTLQNAEAPDWGLLLKPGNPKPLNPEPLNPEPLNPRPSTPKP